MNSRHDENMQELVALLAVDAIDATTGECAAVREHLATCSICREEYSLARAAAAAVGLSASQPPTPQLRQRVLNSLVAQRARLAPAARRSWFIPAVAAAAILIAVGLWWHNNPFKQSWAVTCVAGTTPCHASGTLSVAGNNLMQMRITGLGRPQAGKTYQAWVILPGAPPKPEPTFMPDPNGNGVVAIAQVATKGAVIAVTVEPQGGSQAPTSKPFLSATIN